MLQETTASEAKNRWKEAAHFDEGVKSPIIEIPRSDDQDPESEDEVLDATDTSRIITKSKSKRILSKR